MLSCCWLLLVCLVCLVPCECSLPHIVLILVDDLGHGNIGYNAGSKDHPQATLKSEVVTPNLERLAKEGVTLQRHYTYNYCSPTRSALQTGRYPTHVAVTNEEPTVFNPNDTISGYGGTPPLMTGIAEKLASVGYRRHMTGKWDAGMATFKQTPMGKGYESFFGYYHHANDYFYETLGASSTGLVDECYQKGYKLTDLWNTSGPASNCNGTVYEEELFTANTLRVIHGHNVSEPLFLFHSFHLVHSPLQVPKEWEDKFSFLQDESRRKYAAMVNYMDTQVGTIVDALKAKDMWQNTLLVLSSDNGGPIYSLPGVTAGGANNLPLRGGKLGDFEGGIRANAFISGGFVPEKRRGEQEDRYVHIADWYSTFCAIAGVDPHDTSAEQVGLPGVDGINQWPMLSGAIAKAEQVRTEMYISYQCLISEQYKIITGSDLSILFPSIKVPLPKHLVPLAGYWPGWGRQAVIDTLSKFQFCDPVCLYDIRADPYEKNDIYKENKDLAHKLMARLEELNKSFFAPNRGAEDVSKCDIFQNKYGGFYGPFL